MKDIELETILAEISESDPTCAGCDTPMVTDRHWRSAGPAERQELIDEGYVFHRRRGLCSPCLSDTPADQLPPPLGRGAKSSAVADARMDALLHNYAELVGRGWSSEEACTYLGTNVKTVEKSLSRRRLRAEETTNQDERNVA